MRTERARRTAEAMADGAPAIYQAAFAHDGWRGVADFLQVLDAERTQLEAEDQLAQSRTDAATAYAALYKALGGSWPAPAAKTDR